MDRRTFITGTALGAVLLALPAGAAETAASTARPAAPRLLRTGSRGTPVRTLQQRLAALTYWNGTADGVFGHSTAQAVMAFQKVNGLTADGIAGPATQRALARAGVPAARSTKGRCLEVDLRRQVMMLVIDGRVQYVLNTSTGTSKTPTPKGKFRVFRQVEGWRKAPLGNLYRPKNFHRGYAVHGVKNGGIPARPASHGCTRVSMAAMDMMWGKGPTGVKIGDTVWVY